MIYTSYFAKYKGPRGISVARFKPSWFAGPECLQLAPSEKLLKWWKSLSKSQREATGNIVLYIQQYIKETLNVIPNLAELATELDGKVLLCYENIDKDFCHREVIQCWFEKAGFEVKELTDEMIKEIDNETK